MDNKPIKTTKKPPPRSINENLPIEKTEHTRKKTFVYALNGNVIKY